MHVIKSFNHIPSLESVYSCTLHNYSPVSVDDLSSLLGDSLCPSDTLTKECNFVGHAGNVQ